MIGDKENSTHFVALFLITHLPVFPSVHSLTLILLPAPKGCQFYSISLSKAPFSLLLLCWTPPSAPDHPCFPPSPFPFLVSDPLALPWLQQCLAVHPCGRNGFRQWFFSHAISSHSSRQQARWDGVKSSLSVAIKAAEPMRERQKML